MNAQAASEDVSKTLKSSRGRTDGPAGFRTIKHVKTKSEEAYFWCSRYTSKRQFDSLCFAVSA
jgi:hypothetical protein